MCDCSEGSTSRGSPYSLFSVDECLSVVLSKCEIGSTIQVDLPSSLGHTLAETIVCPIPFPPFRASIKDGYALKISEDESKNSVVKTVIGQIMAGMTGDEYQITREDEVVKIMTGAPLPVGANAILQVEDTEVLSRRQDGSEETIKLTKIPPRNYDIREIGSDMQVGDVVLEKGIVIGGAEIGLLATIGKIQVPVVKPPSIAVISTGDELREPGEEIGKGQIRDSNRSAIIASLKAIGDQTWNIIDLGIAKDNIEDVQNSMDIGCEKADIIITSGGVSMGEADYMKSYLQTHGTIHVGRILMKPGKPLTFATIKNKSKPEKDVLVFATPGNPVSALVTTFLFAVPAIKKICGQTNYQWPIIRVPTIHQLKLDHHRPEYHRAIVKWSNEKNGFIAHSTGYQASSRMLSMRSANALLKLPQATKEKSQIAIGEEIEALLLIRSFE